MRSRCSYWRRGVPFSRVFLPSLPNPLTSAANVRSASARPLTRGHPGDPPNNQNKEDENDTDRRFHPLESEPILNAFSGYTFKRVIPPATGAALHCEKQAHPHGPPETR
jgi:hypothetical protein